MAESGLRIIHNFGMLIAAVGAEETRITNRVQGKTTGIQEEWFMPPKRELHFRVPVCSD